MVALSCFSGVSRVLVASPLFVGALALGLIGGCGGPSAGSAPNPDNPSAQDFGGPAGTSHITTIRVHYPVGPVGAHAITIRGSQAPLGWGTGQAMKANADDVWSFTTAALTAPAEWKPLLDDTTWAQGPNYKVQPGATLDIYPHFVATQGQVVTLWPVFHSNTLNNDRTIYAYLPASYAENTRATYPVIYMHDGQNLWAALPDIAFSGTWNVDTAFDAATQTGACSQGGAVGWAAQPFGGPAVTCNGDGDCPSGDCRTFPEAIVVGVANTSGRIYEYTPTVDPTEIMLGPAGGGDQYLHFLAAELKPQVDAALRTQSGRASTLMMGSSLGGLITAYAGCTQPDQWGRIGELSPSTWWDSEVIIGDVAASKGKTGMMLWPTKVYVDSGTDGAEDDQDGYLETDMLAAMYTSIGRVEGQSLHHVMQQGGQHSEMYWAERLPGALQYLLGAR